MNIPAYSLLIACLLPIVAAGMQKWGARDYDNHNPRYLLIKDQKCLCYIFLKVPQNLFDLHFLE